MPVKYELRTAILEKIRSGEDPLKDIDGRGETKKEVIRAILSGANPYLVSREGTGKTRLAESLAKLLPPVPKIKGCPYNDDPFWPPHWLCPRCRDSENPVEEYGIEFISSKERYSRIQGNEYTNEAKILGLKDIQAIAQGESPTDPKIFMGTGVLRGNRGIVCVDELPAIPTKVQVLFHPILQENKIILEEYSWERPIDIVFIATGNPEGFSHVNRIPEPLLDRLEMIHMDMPEEETEKEIMFKEKFRINENYFGNGKEGIKPEFRPRNIEHLHRKGAVPWWIIDILNKTTRYTRKCPTCDKGASIRGAIKAIDHTYSSLEIENRYVATLRDACDGLKLALRGRIKIRPDLLGFGDKPEESFRKTDEVVEDIMWHASKKVSEKIYEEIKCDDEMLSEEMRFILSGNGFKIDACPEIKKIINWMKSVEYEKAPPDLTETERDIIFNPENLDGRIVQEYNFSALEMILTMGVHENMIQESLVREKIFFPSRLK
ncbi:MAG: AAA family ATPase [Candidatus Syntropharchaeia archaeon]